MLDDTKAAGGMPKQPTGMLMLAVHQTYWLAEGSEYLTPMLDGSGFFPTPIVCVRFKNAFELNEFIGPNRNVMEFWGINPEVVERLRRDNHLSEISGDTL